MHFFVVLIFAIYAVLIDLWTQRDAVVGFNWFSILFCFFFSREKTQQNSDKQIKREKKYFYFHFLFCITYILPESVRCPTTMWMILYKWYTFFNRKPRCKLTLWSFLDIIKYFSSSQKTHFIFFSFFPIFFNIFANMEHTYESIFFYSSLAFRVLLFWVNNTIFMVRFRYANSSVMKWILKV